MITISGVSVKTVKLSRKSFKIVFLSISLRSAILSSTEGRCEKKIREQFICGKITELEKTDKVESARIELGTVKRDVTQTN